MMNRIKPCPFCGCNAALVAQGEIGGMAVFVECKHCHAQGQKKFIPYGVHDSVTTEVAKRYALIAWNARGEL